MNPLPPGVEITTKPEYENLIPKLSQFDYENLKQSVRNCGQHVPIIVNSKGIILDGHRRYRVCKELGIKITYIIEELGDDPLREKLFILDCNIARRQLTTYEKIEVAHQYEPIFAELAKERQLASLKQNSSSLVQNYTNDEKGEVADKCAKIAGVSPGTYIKGRYIIKHASEELKRAIKEKRKSITETYQFLIEQERNALKESEIAEPLSIPEDGIQLFNADFRDEEKKIQDESVDLIFTNPRNHSDPYIISDLLKFAAKVLKHGKCIVMYVDKERIPSIMDQARKAGLKFQWPIVTMRKESPYIASMYGRSGDYQIMLVFAKSFRERCKKIIPDLIEVGEASASDRDLTDANHIINYFSNENEIVCDPFLNSGATAIAALQLNRKIVGFEMDKEDYKYAKGQIEFFRKLQKLKDSRVSSQEKIAA